MTMIITETEHFIKHIIIPASDIHVDTTHCTHIYNVAMMLNLHTMYEDLAVNF